MLSKAITNIVAQKYSICCFLTVLLQNYNITVYEYMICPFLGASSQQISLPAKRAPGQDDGMLQKTTTHVTLTGK